MIDEAILAKRQGLTYLGRMERRGTGRILLEGSGALIKAFFPKDTPSIHTQPRSVMTPDCAAPMMYLRVFARTSGRTVITSIGDGIRRGQSRLKALVLALAVEKSFILQEGYKSLDRV